MQKKKPSAKKKPETKKIVKKRVSGPKKATKIHIELPGVIQREIISPAGHFKIMHTKAVVFWALGIIAFFGVLTGLSSMSNVPLSSPSEVLSGNQAAKNGQATVLTMQEPAKEIKEDKGSVTILATGDILLARTVESMMRRRQDYTFPFHNVADYLKTADITFGNLETPLMQGKTTPAGSMTFRADPEGTQGLLFAGYDILSVANNHSMNYQAPGLLRTMETLTAAGIKYVGGGKNINEAHTPVVFNVKGKKIAFYAYNDPNIPPRFHGEATADAVGIAKMDLEAVKNDVAHAKKYADVVIVSMHAGREYTREPTQFQQDFAHAAIDAGASAVIGHHPHWVQGVEQYMDGVIFYSLGNFVFDQFFSQETQTGLIAKLVIDEKNRVTAQVIPVKMDNTKPRILQGEEKEAIMKKLGL